MHPDQNSPTRLLPVREVTRILQVTHQTVYKLITENTLKGVKIGKEWRVYEDSLTRYLKANTNSLDTPFTALLDTVFPAIEASEDSLYKQVLDLRYGDQVSLADMTDQLQRSASEIESLIVTALSMLKGPLVSELVFDDIEHDLFALRIVAELYLDSRE